MIFRSADGEVLHVGSPVYIRRGANDASGRHALRLMWVRRFARTRVRLEGVTLGLNIGCWRRLDECFVHVGSAVRGDD